MEVEDYMEETALAEAVIDSLGANMLASGFDLAQTRSGGVIITGSKETLEKIPSININYCFQKNLSIQKIKLQLIKLLFLEYEVKNQQNFE